MSDATFQLTVITPERVFFEGPVRSIIAPGGGGSLGVLANHAPLLSTLEAGRLVLTSPEGKKRELTIGSGFLDVMNNTCTLVTETVSEDSKK